MSNASGPAGLHRFILSAMDQDFGCAVLQTMLRVTDLEPLRAILGKEAADDLELRGTYTLGPAELHLLEKHHNVSFEPCRRECQFTRLHSINDVPYLVHTGYELFLMLEGLKPLAKFAVLYPAQLGEFSEEALFEPHVRSGRFIKRIMRDEPFPKPITEPNGRIFYGMRYVFYALPGEEWRIDAHALVARQLVHGPWNDTLERMEGSLLGYTDAQNDWWIADLRRTRGWCWPTEQNREA